MNLENNFRSLFSASPDSIIVVDLERRIVQVNPAAETLFGWSLCDLQDKRGQILYADPRDFEMQGRRRFNADAPAQPEPYIVHYRTKGGRVFNGETVGVPVTDDTGEVTHFLCIIRDVSQRLQMKSRLEASEVQLRAALSSAGEGAFSFDLRSGLGSVRGFINEFLGIEAPDATMSLTRLMECLAPEYQPGFMATIDALKADPDQDLDITCRAQRVDETWRWLQFRGRISDFDRQGAAIRLSGVVADVTETETTRRALIDRERELKEALKASSMSNWRIDLTTSKVCVYGDAARSLSGQDGEFVTTLDHWPDQLHPDDRSQALRDSRPFTADMSQSDASHELTCRLKSASGGWTWYRLIGRITERDAQGQAIQSAGLIQDISDWKQLSSALDDEKRRFEIIYRATPAMLYTINPAGEITEVSDFWLRHMEYDREDVIGRPAVDFLCPDSRERAEQLVFPRMIKGETQLNTPLRYVRKTGERIDVIQSALTEQDESGQTRQCFIVMTDVSALRMAYDQLERTNRELDRFATVASHDLQEPLRKISAFSSLVRRRYEDVLDPEGLRSLDFLVDAAQRMQKLIDDLLTYSRMASQPLRLEEIDLDELVKECTSRLDAAIHEAGARVRRGTLPALQGDRVLIGQILQNLIGNAVKYRSEAAPEILVSAEREDLHWVIHIQDNGIGIDPRFAEKIFAPFQRLHTRDVYQGTGIGLAIVQQAVERHGGRVWVESQPGEGSVFSFTLPTAARSD